MAYGTVKVNYITFDEGAGDVTIFVPDLRTALTSGVTVTGTIGAQRLTATSGVIDNISGINGNIAAISGANIAYATGTVTTLTGVTATYTSGNVANISGVSLIYTSGVFTTLSGVTITATTVSGTLSGNASTATQLSSNRTFALTGDITGSVSSDLSSGASIATSIAAGAIVNADVNASAAIAGTKISPDFGSQAVVTTGTITGASLIPTSSTAPTNGIYLPSADAVGITTGNTERLRIRSDGNIGIGGSGSSIVTLYNQGTTTGGSTAYANHTNTTIQSDVTGTALGYSITANTAAAAFTLTSLQHFVANQGTIGAGSTVTNQYGFYATGNLVGATNNYGFFGSIPSGTGRWNFYASGTAPNYFAGDVRTNTVVTHRAAPANNNVSATLTTTALLDGLCTGTPTADIDFTLPTGTNMDAAFQDLQLNQAFEWSVINRAATTHNITVIAATAHSVIGNMTVPANSSGRFCTRKLTTNSFTTYRIA